MISEKLLKKKKERERQIIMAIEAIVVDCIFEGVSAEQYRDLSYE